MSETGQQKSRRFERAVAAVAGIVTLLLLAVAAWPVGVADPPEMVRFLGRLHPMLVHLPIGFLLALFILEALDLAVRSAILHHATYAMAWLAAFAAVFAVAAGTMLAFPGGFSEELMFRHRWMGTLTAVCAVWILAWKICHSPRESHGWSFAYHPLLAVTAVVLAGAGHYGGSITHGSDYLTAYMPDFLRGLMRLPEREAVEPIVLPDDPRDAVVFSTLVRPILEARCVSCHGTERQRGGLRLDSYDFLIQGGESGPDVNLIAESLRLPLDDERRMPPRERPQLSSDQIALITWWVRTGASEVARVRDLETTSVVERILREKLGLEPEVETVPMLAWSEIEARVEELRGELGVRLQRVARGSDALEIPFVSPGSGFDDSVLARLGPVQSNIQTLNLARAEISDAGLAHIAPMKNLTRLDLSHTSVSDDGLIHLAGLPRLEYLNLVGTGVTDEGLRHLTGVSSLRRLYLWQTGVTDAGLADLHQSLLDEGQIAAWREEIRHLERMIRAADVEIHAGGHIATPAGDDSASAGAESDPSAAANEQCPISGRPVDIAHTVEHDGMRIAFCCGNCVMRFQEDPEPVLVRLAAADESD